MMSYVGRAFSLQPAFQTACRAAALILTAAAALSAQTLASLALSEIPALDSSPTLAEWRNQHSGERLKAAAYDNEYETQGLWCAASIQRQRQAFFYVPVSKPGSPLPAREDKGLIQECRLLALWYEIPDTGSFKSISGELSASFGPAEEPPRFRRTDGDWGSGNWSPYLVWENANRRIVLAVEPMRNRLLLIARASQAPRGLSFGWNGEAPKDQPSLKPCAFDDGRNNWQDGLIAAAEKLRAHLTAARAYDAKLLLTYPGIELNGADIPTDPQALRRNAIAHFRAFLSQNPAAPEAGAAGREAWRLLAGLPPSPLHFACTD
jgi:hypothetical protein